jgi:TonB family protein
MRTGTQLLLNFVVNAAWQICLIALLALLADRLTQSVTRIRHFVWVTALLAAIALPLLSVVAPFKPASVPVAAPAKQAGEPFVDPLTTATEVSQPFNTPQTRQVGQTTAFIILGLALLVMLYQSARLFRALLHTRRLRRTAIDFAPAAALSEALERCRRVFDIENVRVVQSGLVKTPSTIGILKPLVILPHELVQDGDAEALNAAVGHEFVHLMRHDYLLNLIYELVLLPIAFHPAAALIRRRITQTRELRCDELVAERFLQPEAYARSLVRLAGAALPLKRPAQTIIVGIADADILEVRIMSLLRKTKTSFRRSALLIVMAALLLGVPSVVAAAFAIDFKVDFGQEPNREMKEKEASRSEAKIRWDREMEELKQQMDRETDPTVKAKLALELKQLAEERATVFTYSRDGQVFTAQMSKERREQVEVQQRNELAKAAKISMDQAIQIATSSSPGKVVSCNLVGERRREDEADKPTRVLYHVVILAGDDPEAVTNHVWVNAVDGSVVKTERELPKRQNPEYLRERRSGSSNSGTLNNRAVNLPQPEYPLIAMKAGASGTVTVEITVDETGHVVAAHAISGHPLLQAAAVAAARQAVFTPTTVEGQPVKVAGALIYTFVAQ